MALADVIGSLADLDGEEILGRRRTAPIVEARHELFRQLWTDGYSLSEIGHITFRHHTTIMSALRSVIGEEEYDRQLLVRYPQFPFIRKGRLVMQVRRVA